MKKENTNAYEKVNRRIMLVVCIVIIILMLATFVIYLVRAISGETPGQLPKTDKGDAAPGESVQP